ncbi:MAG: L,D-transpeptidase family protein [Gammaproteobacteria bacterium]|nr:L,D-transpeptidase family protein [Gammaproteobacteria bacterium]
MRDKLRIFGILFAILPFVLAEASADEREPSLMWPPFKTVLAAAGFDLEPLKLQWSMLELFYTKRQGQAAWHEAGRLNSHAIALIDWIPNVDRDGLYPADYHLETLRYFSPYTHGKTLQLRELVLTDAFLRLAMDLRLGLLDPETLDPQWRLPPESFDPAQFLETYLIAGNPRQTLDMLRPATLAYGRLQRAYARYRQIEKAGGWPRITVRHTLRPDALDPAVKTLRTRLRIEGDHPDIEPSDPWLYDAQVRAAVRRFQRRNGLLDDGVVGPLTRYALNVPVARRINQLLASLERWRWLPRELGDPHLLVNTAGYELTLVDDGEPVVRKRTISGREKRQTPSFKSRITHLVVNPEWTVPRIIAVEDLLPKQQHDVEFLDQRGIRVLQHQDGQWIQLDAKSLDWAQYNKDNFPFLLRQDSGPKNSLGRFKFHMNNPYAIYLHDTPAVGLFRKPIRAFSSGCVRVQDAGYLARYLVDSGGQSVEELIELPLQSGDTQVTKLSNPIEVYLTYFTSWVDHDGAVQFRPDIYQRDTDLIPALKGSESRLAHYREQPRTESL